MQFTAQKTDRNQNFSTDKICKNIYFILCLFYQNIVKQSMHQMLYHYVLGPYSKVPSNPNFKSIFSFILLECGKVGKLCQIAYAT